ncbi:MAG: HAMP domain-containing histidine kinase, partial [Desulfobacula sp.]|nr:HAMP domain-containing histidine kinase [Desulfobacula sp.]
RVQQLSNFRDIIAIIAGGTFEEELGEVISFYFYSNNELAHISNKGYKIPVDQETINQALSGKSSFSTIKTLNGDKLRIFSTLYTPDRQNSQQERSENLLRPPSRRDKRADKPPRPSDDHNDRPNRPPSPQDRQHGNFRLFNNQPDRPERFVNQKDLQQIHSISSAALIVARPTRDIDEALLRLLQILLIAMPITIVFAGAGGIFLAQRAFKPIDKISFTAKEIEEHDLSRRIEVNTKDELGRLATILNQMIERLEKAFNRQKEFTEDASHELRAPLAVIQAEATLTLQKEREPLIYQKSLELIARETENMSMVINQLLTLARADAAKERMNFIKINLAKFLIDICTDMEVVCQEKGLKLNFGDFETLYVNGDKRNLRNLIHNFLTNSIRYTDKGGTISIMLYQKENLAVLSITDTGIGIPLKALPFIFNRFFRVDKARSRDEGGSGLGLAICKHIADIHRGKIEVESLEDKGSTFKIKLPLFKAD